MRTSLRPGTRVRIYQHGGFGSGVFQPEGYVGTVLPPLVVVLVRRTPAFDDWPTGGGEWYRWPFYHWELRPAPLNGETVHCRICLAPDSVDIDNQCWRCLWRNAEPYWCAPRKLICAMM